MGSSKELLLAPLRSEKDTYNKEHLFPQTLSTLLFHNCSAAQNNLSWQLVLLV